MNLALTDAILPARLRLERPMTDDELFEFCQVNETLRIERDANGEPILLSPTGLAGSNVRIKVTTHLALWAEQVGGGWPSIRTPASRCPIARCARPMRPGCRRRGGMRWRDGSRSDSAMSPRSSSSRSAPKPTR